MQYDVSSPMAGCKWLVTTHHQELHVLSELGRVPLALHLHFPQELVVVETYHTQPSPFFQRIAAQDAETGERERDSLLVGCVKFSRRPKIWEFKTKIKHIILKKRQGKSNHLTLGVFFGGVGMELQFLRSYPTPQQIIEKVNGSQDPCGYG